MKLKVNDIIDVIVWSNGTIRSVQLSIQKWLKKGVKWFATIYAFTFRARIWEKYCLVYDNKKLSDPKQLLSAYGITNKARLSFTRRASPLKRDRSMQSVSQQA